MNKIIKLCVICALTLVGAACANKPKTVNFEWQSDDRRVLLMPTDIQLSELTAGGLEVPKADWTEKADNFLKQSLSAKLNEVNARVVMADDGLDQPPEQVTLVKLHEVVGPSALLLGTLPTKQENPVWTLGPKTQKLKQRYGTDYALFVHVRDSYSSPGRVATAIVAAAFGVSIARGQQSGFATLVDLNTGKVVWNNQLAGGNRDMRNEEGAKVTTDRLLKGFPG